MRGGSLSMTPAAPHNGKRFPLSAENKAAFFNTIHPVVPLGAKKADARERSIRYRAPVAAPAVGTAD